MTEAQIAAYQPIVDAFDAYMAQHSLTRMGICAKVYGRDAVGQPKGSGHLYPIMNGKTWPSETTRERIRAAIGLELPDVPRAPYKSTQTKTVPSARAAVQAYEAAHNGNGKAAAEPEVEPVPPWLWGRRNGDTGERQAVVRSVPKFALIIDQKNRATLTMNMVDIEAELALQTLNALTAVGLLKG
jgi:hypothetical protein